MGEFWYFGGYQGAINTLRQASKIEGRGSTDRLVDLLRSRDRVFPVRGSLSKAVNWFENLICHLIFILVHAIRLCTLNRLFYFALIIIMIKHATGNFGPIIDRIRGPRSPRTTENQKYGPVKYF